MKLDADSRNALPSSDFVFPAKRKFPINDRSHAANAKSRASAMGGDVEDKVDAAVSRKFPGLGQPSGLNKIAPKK